MKLNRLLTGLLATTYVAGKQPDTANLSAKSVAGPGPLGKAGGMSMCPNRAAPAALFAAQRGTCSADVVRLPDAADGQPRRVGARRRKETPQPEHSRACELLNRLYEGLPDEQRQAVDDKLKEMKVLHKASVDAILGFLEKGIPEFNLEGRTYIHDQQRTFVGRSVSLRAVQRYRFRHKLSRRSGAQPKV